MIIYGGAVMSGAGGVNTSLFGDGSDGDFILRENETHTEQVAVPDQSVVVKNYRSFLMEVGSLYQCAARNAGLILRVKGDCTIQGTIDQSALSPKTNPNNNYDYPDELVCGAGGAGQTIRGAAGGLGMPARRYGGGWSGGGAGGGMDSDYTGSSAGFPGATAAEITVSIPESEIFKGGIDRTGSSAVYGGGGSSGVNFLESQLGNGGTGAGGSGSLGGGGAGNVGGGVLLLYVGGAFTLEGSIKCNGANGGSGGRSGTLTHQDGDGSEHEYGNFYAGGAGGGAGGGAFYAVHVGIVSNTGTIQVNGGTGGTAGGTGSITIKQYERGMVK